MGNLSLVFYIYSAEADLTCHAEQTSALIRPSFSSESQESRAAAAVMWCGAPTGNFPHLPETWGFGIQFVDYCVTICRIWQQQACEIREPLMVVDLRHSTHIFKDVCLTSLQKSPLSNTQTQRGVLIRSHSEGASISSLQQQTSKRLLRSFNPPLLLLHFNPLEICSTRLSSASQSSEMNDDASRMLIQTLQKERLKLV